MGEASSSLFPEGIASAADHIKAAQQIKSTADLINRALRPEIRRVVHTCLNFPEKAVERRRAADAYLLDVAERLGPQRLKRQASQPADTPGRNMRLPLFLFLAKSLDFPDVSLIFDLSAGMPLVGARPPRRCRPLSSGL